MTTQSDFDAIIANIDTVTTEPATVERQPLLDQSQMKRLPWFGITELPDGSYTNAETLLQAARLDWKVEESPLFRQPRLIPVTSVNNEVNPPTSITVMAPNVDGEMVLATDVKDIIRDTDGFVLGQVGSKYVPVQNWEAFQFADNLVDMANARWIAAGEQYGGRAVFGLMELHDAPVQVAGEDPFGLYLMVRTSHNGATGVQVSVINVRLRCQNMINLALRGAVSKYSFRHVGNMQGQVAKAREALTISHTYADEFSREMEKMIDMQLSTDGAIDLMERMFAKESDTKRPKMVDGVMRAWNRDDINGYRDTGYGLLNAVTDYFDHDVKRRSATSRFQEQTDGEGAKYRNRVHAALLERV
jgi:phage/plasmid-like protein (TIGR03299 family)